MIQFISRTSVGEYDHDATEAWARSHCRWIADQLQTEVVDTLSSEVKAGPAAIVCDFWDTTWALGALVQCVAVRARPCLFVRRAGAFKALIPFVRSLRAIHAICTPSTHCWRQWDAEWLSIDRDCFFQADWRVELVAPSRAAAFVGCPQAVNRNNPIWTFLNELKYPEMSIVGSSQFSNSTGNYPYPLDFWNPGLPWSEQWRYFAVGKVVLIVQDAQDRHCMTPDSRVWHSWQAGRPVVFEETIFTSREDVWKRWEGNNGQIRNRKRMHFPWEEFQRWTVKCGADLHRIAQWAPSDPAELKAIADDQKAKLGPYYFLNNRLENNVVEYFRCA